MQDLPARIDELDPEQDVVVICHHGIRSAIVAGFLVQRQFAQVWNLVGGIEAWAREVDPAMPRY
jgi:rhodanese-related sulfurtransferase